MSEITLAEIKYQHAKLAGMIKEWEAKSRTSLSIPESTIELIEGEHYAGIVIENGKPAHHLILLPNKPDKRMTRSDAKAWAESVGGSLPERFEIALLYANLRDQFDASQYHWSGTQSSDDYAWTQHFYYGNQLCSTKDNYFFARAVRRLEI
jgi:hypothetical protein